MSTEFRVIPGYERYVVSRSGIIFDTSDYTENRGSYADGYVMHNVQVDGQSKGLSAHRAVALAWVHNPNPAEFNVVNHLDGEPLNNWFENLEWTTYSGNNYHAVNTGLRPDSFACKIRDFETGEVKEFPSIAQAGEYMGVGRVISMRQLQRFKFGGLIASRYEFKFSYDDTPWFYENRTEKVNSRYRVIVTSPDGNGKEIYSRKELRKEFQLYNTTVHSIPALAELASSRNPELSIEVKTVYDIERTKPVRENSTGSKPMSVVAKNGDQELRFNTLTECANHFSVDRSVVRTRLDSGKSMGEWTFRYATPVSND